ncbi:MAG TPA: hypothetical protein VM819_00865 [Vicinamibacterales bacterium]|nr:hypothetical protein [Vicinamibacterales bacterium]
MPTAGRVALCAVLCCSAIAAACSGRVLKPQYEYEEELYLDLDGSATLNLNASVPALVALHGADLPTDARARLDRDRVRALFAYPGSDVTLSTSRRDGRRFVHVSVQVDDVRRLAQMRMFGWSTYDFRRDSDRIDFNQVVGPSRGRDVGDVGWDGSELIAFRMHLPSEILFHNSSADVRRGNILEWEQPLSARSGGEPLELRVQMAPESILYTTLLLFGSTVVAAALTFAAVVWWLARRGRHTDIAESPV